MHHKIASFIFILSLCFVLSGHAQTIRATIIDSISKEPVPFAAIQFADESGVISNTEGKFSVLLKDNSKATDSLFISCMGFKTYKTVIGNFKHPIIFLSPQNIELRDVIITTKKYTADEIIDLVKDNLIKNYTTSLTKKRLFFREHYHQYINRSNYWDFKSSIDAFNKKFVDDFIKAIPKSSDYYTESLVDFYEDFNKKNQKIEIIKASKMYDKNKEFDFDIVEKKLDKILKENVKPNSYLKVKSGIFGTKIDNDQLFGKKVDSSSVDALNKKIEEDKKQKEDETLNFAKGRKSRISSVFSNLIFNEDTSLNFITKSRKYNFTLKELTYLGNDFVYVLNFKPKGGADYKGTLYVNADDFAVVRAEYENVKTIKSFKLLGVFKNDYLDKGKLFFYKNSNNKYTIRYIEKEQGMMAGAKRPLKIIEYNKVVKGKNKQNELSLMFDFASNGIKKYEIVVYDTQEINHASFEKVKEANTISPTYLTRYDPEFWKGYTIIEPNTAIKTFTASE